MKRILAMILCLAMVLVVFLMAGCDKTKPEDTTKAPDNSTPTQSDTDETTKPQDSEDTTNGSDDSENTSSDIPPETEPDGLSKLPGYEDVDFRGQTFRIAAHNGASDQWACDYEIYSEGTDTLSVAVRRRNDLMKKLYNCNIELISTDSPSSLALADVTGNQHTIDMYANKYNMGDPINRYNLASFNINFENPWWDQTFVDTYTIKDNSGADTMWACVGDFAVSAYRAAHAIIYNRTIYETAGITDNVYELVKDKKWTMDKFVEMCKMAATDNDGNSELHYSEGDIMGWVRTGHATHGMHVASGLSIITNENGALKLEMTENAGAWNDVIDKAISVWSIQESETLAYISVHDAIKNGKALFASEVIGTLEVVKDADVSLGLLPYPLYSETQENYAHYVDNHLMYYVVPTSVPDIDVISDFMELFAYHSRYIVRSAWIDVYSYEYCSDVDSGDMLDIILDSRTYDPAYLLWIYEGDISGMISTGKNNLTRWADRTAATIQQSISNYIVAITNANQ